ncbi:MAG: hypothetical protein AB7P76_07090 [Candidatus Melainabacteria bacterium]
MHVFQFKGFSGLMMFMLAVFSTLVVAFVLPTAFTTVTWNAIVFEGFGGPEIAFSQGFILWMAILVLLKIIFKPQFQFRRVNDPAEFEQTLNDLRDKQDQGRP